MAAKDIQPLWPEPTQTMRPWTRWWWLGNAVDKENITHLLTAYREAGLGGVEITPIYGVQGQEAREISYLSPAWIEMLQHTVSEAYRLGLGVDMSTGSGWPFGGPNVSDEDAEDKLVLEKTRLRGGQTWEIAFGPVRPQALAAVSAQGKSVSLRDKIAPDGHLRWLPPPGDWTVYAVTQKWAGRAVKRAAPGGVGKCINPFSGPSLRRYLERFDAALVNLPPGSLRCEFHDSFEYLADWSPTLLEEFARRRGYDLQEHLDALAGDGEPDKAARVRTDYRETLSDLLRENFTQSWRAWAHGKGSLSRNQAHGSPGNLLDLYAAADIPETEIFGGPGDPRINKFASSAAHVLGKPLTSSESCTWLGEHFTVSLADCKAALDGLLAAGINHIFYHGTPYSPTDAAWPGWLFYASTTFAPSDPLWHDFPTLNAYVTRCQSILQTGQPDNDVLLYWPLHDLWQTRPEAYLLEISGKWLTEQPVGAAAQTLWERGFGFDYVSDRQLALAEATAEGIHLPGGNFQAVVVPPCTFLPETTAATLLRLAQGGATIIFLGGLPQDVPGLVALEERRQAFQSTLAHLVSGDLGNVLIGDDLETLLTAARVRRESVADEGILCLRQKRDDGHDYFLAHQGQEARNGWVDLATSFLSAAVLDPMTGRAGLAPVQAGDNGHGEVFLNLAPGESRIVRTFDALSGTLEMVWDAVPGDSKAVPIKGLWTVTFLEGGPVLPAAFTTDTLGSWTVAGGADAARFAGTARYATMFDAPAVPADAWGLDLGGVCESARVRLNGREIATLIAPPFRLWLGDIQPTDNVLEIDITNLAANRIRDMDRLGQPWKIFQEINFVDIHYQPFDASNWPVRDSGLLGPVQLVPWKKIQT
jgi:hypothetical protein